MSGTHTWLAKLDLTVAGIQSSRLASSKMMAGFLPPSSRESFLQWGALSWVMRSAVGWLPVKEIKGTSGWDTRASPTLGPVPNTILITPGGTPGWEIKSAVVILLGLWRTAEEIQKFSFGSPKPGRVGVVSLAAPEDFILADV